MTAVLTRFCASQTGLSGLLAWAIHRFSSGALMAQSERRPVADASASWDLQIAGTQF